MSQRQDSGDVPATNLARDFIIEEGEVTKAAPAYSNVAARLMVSSPRCALTSVDPLVQDFFVFDVQ